MVYLQKLLTLCPGACRLDVLPTQANRQARFNQASRPGDSPVSDEDRMRHALGLDNASSSARLSSGPSQVHRPRRFVKDGEIPVVLMNTGGDRSAQTSTMAKRLADAEAVISNEQAARTTAERALADALATIQRLRTQLACRDVTCGDSGGRAEAPRDPRAGASRNSQYPRELREAACPPSQHTAPTHRREGNGNR